ncbi:YraN family protein [Flagellimonas sp. 389]|uniref:YraN family protein n=1 Tax=Flagellimonas sp. 389 TaxID=2835862 RepID=UPI001BD3FA40|nr:YraN family protein [Flagellimonas sp. 389]MBS9462773.1 YraN family protein [Flagellimonas sp. 389]
MGKHNDLGKLGEQKAVDFLLQEGYEICSRNYRYLKGEIDIIAKKEDMLCIVEVKSRTSGFFEAISDTINKKKIGLLVTTANHYVEENELDADVRFDVITVINDKGKFSIEHLENAFYHF